MSHTTYRTFRWGQGVQIWLVQGRDDRSPPRIHDGPDKTLWGPEQLAWLKKQLLASDADWRVPISPTPIIGPDRVTKNDNHADPQGFWTEGQAFLDWIKETDCRICCSSAATGMAVRIRGRTQWSSDRRIQLRSHVRRAHRGRAAHHRIASRVTQPYAAAIGGFLTVTYRVDHTLTFEFFDQQGKRVHQSVQRPE